MSDFVPRDPRDLIDEARPVCTLRVVGTTRGATSSHELTRSGWDYAHRTAVQLAKQPNGAARVSMICDNGAIFSAYSCVRDPVTHQVACTVEASASSGATKALSGARRRKRRR